jgi:Rrf2 family protein
LRGAASNERVSVPVTEREVTTSSRFATAVHILTVLGYEADRLVTSDVLAVSVNTNPVVIRRLLRALSDAGLVESVPGKTGGSRLARPAAKITLLDAFAAVEPEELFGSHARQPDPNCAVGGKIVKLLRPRFDHAKGALAASLRRTTIADLLRDVRHGRR